MVLIILMSMIIAKIGDDDEHDNHNKRYDDDDVDNKGYDDDDEVYLAKLGLNILWLGSKNHQRLSSVWIKIIILIVIMKTVKIMIVVVILMMKMVKIMIVMMKTVEIMIVMNFLLPK